MSDEFQEHPSLALAPASRPARMAMPFANGVAFVQNKIGTGLFFTVIVPNILLFLYLTLIATPQYISEAHFMVRGEHSMGSMPLSLAMQTGAGESVTSDDTFAVQDYLMSRDAMALLLRNDNLAQVFSRKEGDFLARFPNWYSRQDLESFYKYYKRHIKAQIDSDTSLSVLTVRTFSADDSQRIAKALIAAAEDLVNDINRRQRANLVDAAQREVTETLDQIRDLQTRLASFRNTSAMIDPEKQSVPLISTQYALQSLLTATQMRLDQTRQTSPDSPTIEVYQQQIENLRKELDAASSRLTGDTHSLVPQLTEFDALTIQRQILQQILAAEVTSLQSAKARADHQMVFLEEVTQPDKPDYPTYPPTIEVMAVSILCCYGIFIMGRLLIAGAREHRIT
ncbi:capsule biosynthesis protein [Gluconacetobacter takamatsuzukensis]|uniref:Capsule biosynthesis protein n=1 Tax=Gluconacetobacter takamatsuzukensis TaxID=1286190 RepID=A0A7W4KDH2_9PROT|nr:capsule biosynthesis protein [Gluconacetobacter takamatsuzukensis]MBB2204869.1 capsule biosynthesis protein [Gluconacetobacter takamatsuzukensis]